MVSNFAPEDLLSVFLVAFGALVFFRSQWLAEKVYGARGGKPGLVFLPHRIVGAGFFLVGLYGFVSK